MNMANFSNGKIKKIKTKQDILNDIMQRYMPQVPQTQKFSPISPVIQRPSPYMDRAVPPKETEVIDTKVTEKVETGTGTGTGTGTEIRTVPAQREALNVDPTKPDSKESPLKRFISDPKTYEILTSIAAIASAYEGDDKLAEVLSGISGRIGEGREAKRQTKADALAEKLEGERVATLKGMEIEADENQEGNKIINKQISDFNNEINELRKTGYKVLQENQKGSISKAFLIDQLNPVTKETVVLIDQKKLNKRKAEIEKEVKYNKSIKSKNQEIRRQISRLITKKDGVYKITDLGAGLTGNRYKQTFIRGTGSPEFNEASAAIDFIKGNLTLDRLQEIRNNSPTGGSLGNVSDKDIKLLEGAASAIRMGVSPDAFSKELGVLLEKLDKFDKVASTSRKELLNRTPFEQEEKEKEISDSSTGKFSWSPL